LVAQLRCWRSQRLKRRRSWSFLCGQTSLLSSRKKVQNRESEDKGKREKETRIKSQREEAKWRRTRQRRSDYAGVENYGVSGTSLGKVGEP